MDLIKSHPQIHILKPYHPIQWYLEMGPCGGTWVDIIRSWEWGHHDDICVLVLPHAKSWLIGKDWCWEGLGTGGEGDDRGWDGWIASLTRWTWVWVNSGSWWWTGRPGVVWFMGSPRVRHDWATDLIWYKCSYPKQSVWLRASMETSWGGVKQK